MDTKKTYSSELSSPAFILIMGIFLALGMGVTIAAAAYSCIQRCIYYHIESPTITIICKAGEAEGMVFTHILK